jgi:hypothetical protein
MCVVYNRCHGSAVQELWALWDSVYDFVYLLNVLYDLDSPVIVDGNLLLSHCNVICYDMGCSFRKTHKMDLFHTVTIGYFQECVALKNQSLDIIALLAHVHEPLLCSLVVQSDLRVMATDPP